MLKPWFVVVWFLAHEWLEREKDTEKTPGRAYPCAGGGREWGEGGEKGREGEEGGRGKREGGERGREGREGGEKGVRRVGEGSKGISRKEIEYVVRKEGEVVCVIWSVWLQCMDPTPSPHPLPHPPPPLLRQTLPFWYKLGLNLASGHESHTRGHEG